MNVLLTPELERLVREKVASGMYNSASEVIYEGLKLLQERDLLREYRLQELRNLIELGVTQIDSGEYDQYEIQQTDILAQKIKERARKKKLAQGGDL